MRRIKNAIVKRLALCKRGKNGMTTLFKSEGGNFEFATLTKGNEKGELLSVMWPKGIADADGDFADTVEAIKSMTSSLIQNGGALDIEHDGKVLDPSAAYITEVFTIQKSDPRFADWKDYSGESVDVTGGAAVKIQIDDPDLRQAYRDGDWDGVSLFGPAAVEHVDIVAASQRVAARMGGSMQENEMTDKELQAALDAQKAELMTLFKSALGELAGNKVEAKEANEDDGAEKQPTFTGDVNDPQALKDYEGSLRAFEMRKAIAAGDMSADDIAQMRKSMQETGPSVADLVEHGIDAKPEDTKDVRDLQVKLFKAQGGTNVPARQDVNEVDELAKAHETEGLALGKLINQHLGSASPDAGGMRIVG